MSAAIFTAFKRGSAPPLIAATRGLYLQPGHWLAPAGDLTPNLLRSSSYDRNFVCSRYYRLARVTAGFEPLHLTGLGRF